MNNLLVETTVIENINNKNEILKALCDISDEDFNGNNGNDYLWDISKNQGFKTNQEFVINLIKQKNYDSYQDLINAYFNEWFIRDYYYRAYNVNITEIGIKAVVTLSAITES